MDLAELIQVLEKTIVPGKSINFFSFASSDSDTFVHSIDQAQLALAQQYLQQAAERDLVRNYNQIHTVQMCSVIYCTVFCSHYCSFGCPKCCVIQTTAAWHGCKRAFS